MPTFLLLFSKHPVLMWRAVGFFQRWSRLHKASQTFNDTDPDPMFFSKDTLDKEVFHSIFEYWILYFHGLIFLGDVPV